MKRNGNNRRSEARIESGIKARPARRQRRWLTGAGMALGVLCLAPGASEAADYVVTNTNDSGVGSLRWAITAANNNLGPDTVKFNIPAAQAQGGVFVIKPASELPIINWGKGDGTVIDGSTQTAFTGNTNANGPEVVLSGELAVGLKSGLIIKAPSCLVKRLVIQRWGFAGVMVDGTKADGVRIEDCYIGTNPAGTAAASNQYGVQIQRGALNTTVGGSGVGKRNLISGNQNVGVNISSYLDKTTKGTQVRGNYIGLNRQGTAALGNGLSGVRIAGVQNSVRGNIISGNGYYGVDITGKNLGQNYVYANYVGTNAAGSAAVPNRYGVWVAVDTTNNVIGSLNLGAGNVISGNSMGGVMIRQNVWLTKVQGNLIGTDHTGTSAVPNGGPGVTVEAGAASNTIGGKEDGARNVISGNAGSGVVLQYAGTFATQVVGNYIGTDVTGALPLGNGADGITLGAGVTSTIIGGTSYGGDVAKKRNIIAANGRHGIHVSGEGQQMNKVQGNYIGVNADATAALPNAQDGVHVTGKAYDLTVGGTDPGAGNVISGNGRHGVHLSGTDTAYHRIFANRIGTNGNGLDQLPNGDAGVFVDYNAGPINVGGVAAGQGNVIAYNAGDGVVVNGAPKGVSIRGNALYANAFLGIDLRRQGDHGPHQPNPNEINNNVLNHPVIHQAAYWVNTSVSGTFKEAKHEQYRLDFYASAAADPSGYGEGSTYLGSLTVTTDQYGVAPFVFVAPGNHMGKYITATATRSSTLNTSEFCQAKRVKRLTFPIGD